MKKLHGIKIIYISKKKRKISNARNEFSDEEETKEFRDSQKTVSPTIGKDRLRIWKAWMDPITRQLSPSRGPPSSPEKHHRAPTRFTVCFHSKSKPGERPLERRSITRHNKHRCPLPSFPPCPRFVLLFYCGDGKKGSNKDHMNRRHMMMENRSNHLESYLQFKRQFVRSMNLPKFSMRINTNRLIHSFHIAIVIFSVIICIRRHQLLSENNSFYKNYIIRLSKLTMLRYRIFKKSLKNAR